MQNTYYLDILKLIPALVKYTHTCDASESKLDRKFPFYPSEYLHAAQTSLCMGHVKNCLNKKIHIKTPEQ